MNKKLINKSVLLITLCFNYACTPDKIKDTTILNNISVKAEVNNPEKALLAGSLTVFDHTDDAFEHPSANLSKEDKEKFSEGESFFDQNWLIAPSATKARDGLGPFFNGKSCASCHSGDGRGKPPAEGEQMESLLLRVSIPGKGDHNQPVPSKIYGDQIQGFSVPGIKPEVEVNITYEDIKGAFSDGEAYTLKKPIYKIVNGNYGETESNLMISPRIANQMGGMGLLEDIAENDLLAFSDPDDKDKDGISGRPNYVWDVENNKLAMGRFGWKSNQPSIRQQVAGAFSGDIGITTSIFPKENFSDTEFKSIVTKNVFSGGEPELSDKNLEKVVVYSRNLSIPSRRDINSAAVIQGERTFSQLSCNKCHVADMKSQGETIHPYTDLLLHDMGENLADHRPDFLADGNEWRTAPLWTIGLFKTVNKHTNYLHDGRANNLTEAILWHGGEAEKSKDDFKKLPKTQREALVAFLDSL